MKKSPLKTAVRRIVSTALATVALSLIAGLHSFGQPVDIMWSGSDGGDFNTVGNWTGTDLHLNFPGNIGLANNSEAGPYTVNFSDDFTLGRLQRWYSSSLTYALNGNTVNLTSTGTGDNASVDVRAWGASVANAEIIFDGGGNAASAVNSGHILLRDTHNPKVTLTNSVTLTNPLQLTYSTNLKTASFSVINGSSYVSSGSGQVVLMTQSGGETDRTDLVISGAGSSFTARTGAMALPAERRTVNVGTQFGGLSAVSVTAGADFTADQVTVGGYINNPSFNALNPRGEVLVEGTGSTFEAKWVTVGGGRTNVTSAPAAMGDGYFIVRDGGAATVEFLSTHRRDAGIQNGNPFDARYGRVILDGGTLTLSGDSTFAPSTLLEIHLNSAAQSAALSTSALLTITDADLSLIVDDSYTPLVGSKISLIEYSSLVGSFSGISEGDTILLSDGITQAMFSYNLDASNVIGLTIIPEPGLIALLAAICALVPVVLRRRR